MSINTPNTVYSSGHISLSEIETLRGKRVLLDLGVDAVLVVPRTKNGTYILTKQRRSGKDGQVWEFPSGGIKPGESPEIAAARELLEEVGAIGELRLLVKTEPLSGLVKLSVYIFVADIKTISESARMLEDYEDVSIVEMSREELMKNIHSWELVDGYVVLGLGALSLSDHEKIA